MRLEENEQLLAALHFLFGKCMLASMTLGVYAGAFTKSNIGWGVAVCAGIINGAYTAWKWRHNIRVAKKYPNRPIE